MNKSKTMRRPTKAHDMNEKHDIAGPARWIVCEASGRWSPAVRRFSPILVPPHGIACVATESSAVALAELTSQAPRILLWECSRERLVQICDAVTQAALRGPKSLQLVACAGIGLRHQIALAEFPVAGFVRHPEDLPRLKPMVQGYFARWSRLLD
jgi:hypothetical protein